MWTGYEDWQWSAFQTRRVFHIMLVLTRKRDEVIHISDGIVIKIISTGRSTVKIGIQAPGDVRILRGELCSPGHPPTRKTATVMADDAAA